MVSEAPAHPSTKMPMLLKAPAHLRHQGSDGAQSSSTTKGLVYPWCPWLPHIQAPMYRYSSRHLHIQCPRLPIVSEAPVHPSTKVPMLLEAPVHPSTKVPMLLEAAVHPSTKVPMLLEALAHPRHQGADGTRGSSTSEAPRC
ncbi:hypothetical protein GOBAR_AA13379 [Gossypium barbadense]|uniref:Uncharacterized protein n=1 Tax=Gossypium barbadense TaxID=3634 RepID=A0A2P5XV94_GOSBA|nr:hypothetical protein GOBAR_AA13379 [Gossypium barbadense]